MEFQEDKLNTHKHAGREYKRYVMLEKKQVYEELNIKWSLDVRTDLSELYNFSATQT